MMGTDPCQRNSRIIAYLSSVKIIVLHCLPHVCCFYHFVDSRYRQSLDPTLDEVRRLATGLRRSARDERVLFHYNGHGVSQLLYVINFFYILSLFCEHLFNKLKKRKILRLLSYLGAETNHQWGNLGV
jgi:hypothetical protein